MIEGNNYHVKIMQETGSLMFFNNDFTCYHVLEIGNMKITK